MINANMEVETELPKVWRNLRFQTFKTFHLVTSTTPMRLQGVDGWI